MTAMTKQEACEDINEGSSNCDPDALETDDTGQLVIYTGIFRHLDGSYHDEEEYRLARALDIASGARFERNMAALVPALLGEEVSAFDDEDTPFIGDNFDEPTRPDLPRCTLPHPHIETDKCKGLCFDGPDDWTNDVSDPPAARYGKHVSGVVCPPEVDCDAVRCQNARNAAADEFKK